MTGFGGSEREAGQRKPCEDGATSQRRVFTRAGKKTIFHFEGLGAWRGLTKNEDEHVIIFLVSSFYGLFIILVRCVVIFGLPIFIQMMTICKILFNNRNTVLGRC